MFFLWNLVFFIAEAQNSLIEVTFNDQTVNIYNSDLTVNKLMNIFCMQRFSYLEDLSGIFFIHYMMGVFHFQ